ncbi:unnamed protein product [Acanthoscelides obtectus]|uniref:Transposase n=1 Tax=Acanthoscelides obtectus TaxID=200917 RepID=A0A9P0M7X2_ACAOB|nr:unnamed protein product [Acanthoscelides obtectus]CAK1675931.1 Histone-lysine N-methyltransferase SETMAR [Acanthoscelides obtectus]
MQPSTDGNRVDENPSTSTRDVAREVQVSKTKVWQTLREEGLYPFHVQRVQVLQPDDFPARVRFCEWLLHQHDNNPDFLKCILVTDESTFTQNPHAVRQAHFQQTFSVNVWAGMVNGMLIGPFILPNRLDGMQYLDFLRNILPSLLEDVPLSVRQSMWFLHDVREFFNELFPNKWIGQHFRAIIYYNFQRQLSQQECLSVFGNEAPQHLSDDPRVGAPKTPVTQENVDSMRKLIIEDRHVTYREIEASLNISKTSIQKKLHEELGVRKLVSRWIPHMLTGEQKAVRVNCIISGDESWIYCYEPENKRQSAVWVFQGEEKPTEVIRSRTGHIATIPLNEQRTVTEDWYTTIYNASSHTAQKTRQSLTEENVELLDHPPYNPDLSPNDFFTFPKIKNRLRGQRFQSPEEAVGAFKNAVSDLPANEWNKCFENWFERMQMCINLRGEYFEKQ